MCKKELFLLLIRKLIYLFLNIILIILKYDKLNEFSIIK